MGRDADTRASDREREATTLRLRAAHLEGRLDTDALELRIDRAQRATTRGDLMALEDDLPERMGSPLRPTSGVPWWPGTRPFNERKLLNSPVDQVREAAITFIVPSMEQSGYRLLEEHPDRLVFFGLGERVTVRLRDAGDRRTLVLAHGIAPLSVRRAFAKLTD
jgi:hypothetical protein